MDHKEGKRASLFRKMEKCVDRIQSLSRQADWLRAVLSSYESGLGILGIFRSALSAKMYSKPYRSILRQLLDEINTFLDLTDRYPEDYVDDLVIFQDFAKMWVN